MDPYHSEEDQVKALKQWWDENGSSTMIGLGLAMAIVFGWQWWQQRLENRTTAASIQYQELLQATQLAEDDDVQRTTAKHLAGELQNEFAGTRYADYGALVSARLAVEDGDLAAAESELRALLERQPDAATSTLLRRLLRYLGRHPDATVGAVARIRLARVLLAKGEARQARELLDAARSEDFALEKSELRGDIERALGNAGAAREAYAQAIELAGDEAGRLLELKLQEATMDAAAAPAESHDEAAAEIPQDSAAASEEKP